MKTAIIVSNDTLFIKEFHNILTLEEFDNEKVFNNRELTYNQEFVVDNLKLKTFKSSNKLTYDVSEIIRINNTENSEIRYNNIDKEIIINTITREIAIEDDIDVYHNYKKVNGMINYKINDELIINCELKIKFSASNKIEIETYGNLLVTTTLNEITRFLKMYKHYPIYTNSPRVIKELSDTKIDLKKPTEDAKSSTLMEVLKRIVPTLVTASMTVGIALFIPRGPYVLISLATTVMTIIFTISKYFKDKKDNKVFNKKREEVYEKYLAELEQELNITKKSEKQAREFNDPSYDTYYKSVLNSSERLYERDINSDDFLSLRIGTTTSNPTYKLGGDIDKLAINKSELELQVEELYKEFEQIEDVPQTLNLFTDNIGLVGKHELVNREIHKLVLNIAFNQSYLDVRFVFIINEKDLEEFKDYRFLKHTKHPVTNLNSIIYNEDSREQILGSLLSLFRTREQSKTENELPNIIFVVTNFELLNNHPILEFILKDKKDYGYSIIQSSTRREELLANINSVVIYHNNDNATLHLDSKKVVDKEIKLDQNKEDLHSQVITRKLGALVHQRTISSSLPSSLGFLEMFEVEDPQSLNIRNRWQINKSYKSLAVRLGKKTEHEYLELNLHEKAHGPHGLVAGTTGSGKSEVIQSYILSLAVNYSPEEIGFLLIDYKGGGMANLFKDLPHLLGTITNLDGYQAMRALASIKSELKRRQKIFSDNDVNHINDYHKLYENNEVTEPIPHLFLISDEFAELKSEQPEFMKELVSAARIGRSLGIHLILATQKPSGVVDDQIWSNSKFKLSLKVAEEADSRELLKTTDAAYIKEPGRGYLKVGTNEEYVLFQSAYSGAPYLKESEQVKDTRIYILDVNGNKRLINQDLSKTETKGLVQSELDAVVKQIETDYTKAKLKEVPAPWLPPLETQIVKNLENIHDNNSFNFTIELGIVDLPDKQAQQNYQLNLLSNPVVGIFGQTKMGKTTLILKMLLELANQNSSQNLRYYIIDLANSGLINLSNLNHTAEYIRINDEDKHEKFIKLMNKEIVRRRKILEEALASNYERYIEMGKTDLSMDIIVIENYNIVKELTPTFADEIMRIIRDGSSLGIVTITSSPSLSGIKVAAQSLYTEKIQFYTDDKYETSQTVGKVSEMIPEISGRAFIRLEKPEVIQFYDYSEYTTAVERTKDVSESVIKINELNPFKNIGIPIMPKVIEYVKPPKPNMIYLGKDYEEVKDIFIPVTDMVIGGKETKEKLTFMKNIINQLSNNYDVIILDDSREQLKNIKNTTYINSNYLEELDRLENNNENQEDLSKVEKLKRRLNNIEIQRGKVYIIRSVQILTEVELKEKQSTTKMFIDIIQSNIPSITCLESNTKVDEITKCAKEAEKQILLGKPTEYSSSFLRLEKELGTYVKDDLTYIFDESPLKIKSII